MDREMVVKGGLLKGSLREHLAKGVTGEMCILGKDGDLRVTWNARDPDEVEAARHQFNDLRDKGFLAYKVTERGGKGEAIRNFDPQAQKVILAPPLAGG